VIKDLLFIGFGTTEFWLRHARSIKNPFPHVPHKIAILSASVI
jgi:hypothetical protein